mgnify:FL=1
MSDNVVNIIDYRSSVKEDSWSEDDSSYFEEMEDSVMIGWVVDENGDRSLHIVSAVSTVSCLWMIDLAKSIVESRPPKCRNDNE